MESRRENEIPNAAWYPAHITLVPTMQPYYTAQHMPHVGGLAFYPISLPPTMCPITSFPTRPSIFQESIPPPTPQSAPGSPPSQLPLLPLPPLAQTPPQPSGQAALRDPSKKNDKQMHKHEHGIYKCSKCERTYLSYPALYTHIKIKHPQPKTSASSTKSTNRGRPKKSVW